MPSDDLLTDWVARALYQKSFNFQLEVLYISSASRRPQIETCELTGVPALTKTNAAKNTFSECKLREDFKVGFKQGQCSFISSLTSYRLAAILCSCVMASVQTSQPCFTFLLSSQEMLIALNVKVGFHWKWNSKQATRLFTICLGCLQ